MCFANPEKYQEWKLLSLSTTKIWLLSFGWSGFLPASVSPTACTGFWPHQTANCASHWHEVQQSINPLSLMGKLIHWTPSISRNPPKLWSVGYTLLWHRAEQVQGCTEWGQNKDHILGTSSSLQQEGGKITDTYHTADLTSCSVSHDIGKKCWVDMAGIADQTSASCAQSQHCWFAEQSLQWVSMQILIKLVIFLEDLVKKSASERWQICVLWIRNPLYPKNILSVTDIRYFIMIWRPICPAALSGGSLSWERGLIPCRIPGSCQHSTDIWIATELCWNKTKYLKNFLFMVLCPFSSPKGSPRIEAEFKTWFVIRNSEFKQMGSVQQTAVIE